MSRVALEYGLALLGWAAALYRLPTLRSGGQALARRAHWLTLFALALALTVRLPQVESAVDRLAGFPNIGQLLEHSFVLVAAWAVQEFLFYLNYPEVRAPWWSRAHSWVLIVALVALSILSALGLVHQDVPDFWGQYARAPYVIEYRLVFLVCLGASLVNVVRLSWRYAGLSAQPAVYVGLRFVAAGGVIGLGYVVHEALYVTTRRFGFGYPLADPALVRELLIAGALVPLLLGSTMPAWGERAGIAALSHWVVRYRTYRRLYRLWRDLVRASPEVTLLPPPSNIADALTVRNHRFLLYRRMIEIWDGRLALRAYMEPQVAAYAAALCQEQGLSADESHLVAEAATLAAAVRAKQRGQPAVTGAIQPASPQPLRTLSAGSDEGGTEEEVLVELARCYEHSPIVHTVLARMEGEGSSALAPRLGRRSV